MRELAIMAALWIRSSVGAVQGEFAACTSATGLLSKVQLSACSRALQHAKAREVSGERSIAYGAPVDGMT